jgi:hypothetical protein
VYRVPGASDERWREDWKRRARALAEVKTDAIDTITEPPAFIDDDPFCSDEREFAPADSDITLGQEGV